MLLMVSLPTGLLGLTKISTLGSFDALELTDEDDPQPGPREVVVRIHACSLNHRDLNIVNGSYGRHPLKPAAIPVSDGAGEITAPPCVFPC